MNLFKRAGAAALALTLMLGCLSGCGSKEETPAAAPSGTPLTAPIESVDLAAVTDPFLTTAGVSADTVVATAGDVEITAGQLLYWMAYSADNLLNSFSMYGMTELPWDTDIGDGMTLSKSVKDNSLTTAALYAMLPGKAAEAGVQLPEDFAKTMEESKPAMAEELGGEEMLNYYLWQYPLNWETYYSLCESEEYNNAIAEKHYGEGTEGYPTDDEIMTYLKDDQGCYFFKHILFLITEQTDAEGKVTGDNSAEQKKKAEEVLAQLRASDDPLTLFDQLMSEHTEDGGLAMFPNGYLGSTKDTSVTGSKMVGVVEEACMSMEDYEISDVLENATDGGYRGYHIVLKLPLEENVVPAEHRQTLIAQGMDEIQQLWLADTPVTPNETFEALDAGVFFKSLQVLRQTVNEAFEAAQPAASTSAAG